MKKLIILIIALSVIFPICSNSQDLTLDEILENHFEVMKTEKFAEVNSVYAEGKVITQGMEMPFVQKSERPGKIRLEVTVQGNQMVQAYNGETGWMITPWIGTDDAQDMGEDEVEGMKEQADFEGKLWNWKEKVENLELIGKEDMEGTEVYKLKMTEKLILKEGETEEEAEPNVRYYYMDAEDFVILKVQLKKNMRGAEVEIENYQSNYKEVDGFIMAHSMETKMGGQTYTQISIEKVEFNKEFEDSIFERPEKE